MADCKPDAAAPRLNGTALVLEDALIVAYDAAAMLDELGVRQVQVCGTLREALTLIEAGLVPSVALLDINLGGETSLDAALALARLQVPILYSTGYDEVEGAIADFPRGAMLRKPYTAEDMSKALTEMGFLNQAQRCGADG
jgi:CheY-like chemotaxis protein